jgi:hypothetical protein
MAKVVSGLASSPEYLYTLDSTVLLKIVDIKILLPMYQR